MEAKTISDVTVALKAVDDGKHGAFEAILSAPMQDRDGEYIDARAFEPLPPRINIDVDHAMSAEGVIGSGTPFYDGDVLKFKGTFSSLPRAQEFRTLITEGHLDSMSVAFMNAQRYTDDDGQTHIGSAELLNAAVVGIPSLREASITSIKNALQLLAADESPTEDIESAASEEPAEKATAPALAPPLDISTRAKAEAVLVEADLLLAE
jgi:hypothetical protein